LGEESEAVAGGSESEEDEVGSVDGEDDAISVGHSIIAEETGILSDTGLSLYVRNSAGPKPILSPPPSI